ncbi:MAG TPA: MauE/DoxX family redox-associated membrane protein [Candidatus Acidoferrales bacterium]|nr:MauE/DoxX family redox-associated membrane protein [Candidatus Acidoferrales bacterium]
MSSPRSKWGGFLLLLGRLGLAVIFLLAAYAKLRPQDAVPWSLASLKITPTSLGISSTFFAMQIDSFQLLPAWAVSPFAHTLPWLEFVVGVLLLLGLGLRYVSVIASLLIALFFAVVVRTYALHIAINCGCFGPNEKLGPWTLVRDGTMLALAIAVTIGAFVVHRRGRTPFAPAASNS